MKATVYPSPLSGTVEAIPSKSMAHRLLICAALSPGDSRVVCPELSQDIEATVRCLRALGSDIKFECGVFTVPQLTAQKGDKVLLDCKESGTTLRLLLCVSAGLGIHADFTGAPRLFMRPLAPLDSVLESHGVRITRDKEYPLSISGEADATEYSIDGGVSSQYISGLLMMQPLCRGKGVWVTGAFESKPYVLMTAQAMRSCGLIVDSGENEYKVSGSYALKSAKVEGDWSNAAFFLCAGAIGGEVTVQGVSDASLQGDRAIADILMRFGADIDSKDNTVVCKAARLSSTELDVSDIPDLVPTLAVTAAFAKGKTVLHGAARLRYKESDRLSTVTELVNSLGGKAVCTKCSITVYGTGLSGGVVDAHNDHRIVMAAAVAACGCSEPVVINGAQAAAKSYPGFFLALTSLGAKTVIEE